MILSGTLLILSGILAVVLLIHMFWVSALPHTPGPDDHQPDKEEMKKFIVWKSFYVNPNDPRGWAPKTWGYGWTVNFRQKKHAAVFALLIICCLGTALLGVCLMLMHTGNPIQN